MAQKTKKQHYVPQSYLNAWDISGKHQIYVFDKTSESKRINNIQDVASENYFYDINPNDIFSHEFMESLHEQGITCDDENDSQIIERAFAEEIEKPFSDLLKTIIDKASALTPWHIKNCFFISEDKKLEFSGYLSLQLIRTKHIRSSIRESADCLIQVMKDMGFPNVGIAKYAVSKEKAKRIHINMLLDSQHLVEIVGCFYQLTWMLGVNKTQKKFFTSDTPIGTWGHIKDPILPMNGIASRGVEAFFPLSPDVILIMVDGSYHTHCLSLERKYIEITEDANIDYYNSILAMQAERLIFSADDNMTLLDSMKKRNPGIFKEPHVQTKWGGKTYYSKGTVDKR